MSIQKYNGSNNLWDTMQGMQELGLDLESQAILEKLFLKGPWYVSLRKRFLPLNE